MKSKLDEYDSIMWICVVFIFEKSRQRKGNMKRKSIDQSINQTKKKKTLLII